MAAENRRSHWEHVYEGRSPTEVSWYQQKPEASLRLVRATGVDRLAPIIDVGGGASTLVDFLLADGYTDITVLDVSGKALARSQARLGKRQADVQWVESDVTTFAAARQYALWHDRAVFHFLTDSAERARYLDVLCRSLGVRGFFVLSTFGPDGPERCSGLPVQRYGIDSLRELLADRFDVGDHELETHETPGGSEQQFLYSWWRRRD